MARERITHLVVALAGLIFAACLTGTCAAQFSFGEIVVSNENNNRPVHAIFLPLEALTDARPICRELMAKEQKAVPLPSPTGCYLVVLEKRETSNKTEVSHLMVRVDKGKLTGYSACDCSAGLVDTDYECSSHDRRTDRISSKLKAICESHQKSCGGLNPVQNPGKFLKLP